MRTPAPPLYAFPSRHTKQGLPHHRWEAIEMLEVTCTNIVKGRPGGEGSPLRIDSDLTVRRGELSLPLSSKKKSPSKA